MDIINFILLIFNINKYINSIIKLFIIYYYNINL